MYLPTDDNHSAVASIEVTPVGDIDSSREVAIEGHLERFGTPPSVSFCIGDSSGPPPWAITIISSVLCISIVEYDSERVEVSGVVPTLPDLDAVSCVCRTLGSKS